MNQECRYFVAKVASIQALRRCAETNIWACRDRVNPPHPRTVLSTALEKSRVILIFSVNNCHGWHGYAEMLGPPRLTEEQKLDNQDPEYGKVTNDTCMAKEFNQTCESAENDLTTLDNSSVWYHFPIEWKVCYIKEFGEQCLSSKRTESLQASEDVALNKARNWQEVSATVGDTVCSMMDQWGSCLCERRSLQELKVIDKLPKPFFKEEEKETSAACEETWNKIVEQIEAELGPVILACPFGSQRYNLSVPDSDTDMFIVYQAKTRDLLGFHPPKQTIKNSERESCDYTIHEAYRYAELLLSGDARCVETLFLGDTTVVKSSPQWQALKTGRHRFLNQETLNKYLRDAQGTRGTKQLRKWCDDNPSVTNLPKKMCKLLYVIVRLLQNARDIVQGRELCVFRENYSTDRTTLMRIREGDITVENAWEIITSLESEIEENKDRVPSRHTDTEQFLEDWLLELRKTDFINMHGVTERRYCNVQ